MWSALWVAPWFQKKNLSHRSLNHKARKLSATFNSDLCFLSYFKRIFSKCPNISFLYEYSDSLVARFFQGSISGPFPAVLLPCRLHCALPHIVEIYELTAATLPPRSNAETLPIPPAVPRFDLQEIEFGLNVRLRWCRQKGGGILGEINYICCIFKIFGAHRIFKMFGVHVTLAFFVTIFSHGPVKHQSVSTTRGTRARIDLTVNWSHSDNQEMRG